MVVPAAARRRPKSSPSTAAAAWGYYAALVLPEPTEGGSDPGLVQRRGKPRAFWAAWWRDGDPRLAAHPPEPDDYGFVTGERPLDEAVGAAYDALRRGRGAHIYDVCIGETWAIRAYSEGAPTRRSTATDFAVVAARGREMLGLADEATPADVKAAWRAYLRRVHPDQGGAAGVDLDAAKRIYEAVLAEAQRGESQGQRDAVAAGRVVVDPATWTKAVRSVARRVRSCLEQLVRGLIVPRHDGATMGGYCTVASLGVVHALREAGLDANLATGQCGGIAHWWAIVRPTPQDPWTIVDITATQFGAGRPAALVAAPGSKAASRYDLAKDPQTRSHDVPTGWCVSEVVALMWRNFPTAWWRTTGVALSPEAKATMERRLRTARREGGTSRVTLAECLARVA